MSKTVISVENLSKYYRLGVIGGATFREEFSRWWARRLGRPDPYAKIGQADHGNRAGEHIWALRDIDLEVREGEILGVIGRNGAGKSTLLKILSRITAPTSGRAVIRGRVGSLLEVGTGFHPELTGRENIYLNGTLLGMSRAEVGRKLEEIVEFAEMGKFIDTPVKRYSSGMTVRLAFAVAAHLEPEILIVDEVLAVGDAAFQAKCIGKMGQVAKGGRTILFVSHNLAAVSRLCERAVWLRGGEIELDGSCEPVVRQYEEPVSGSLDRENLSVEDSITPIMLKGVSVLGTDRTERESISLGSGCIFEIRGFGRAWHENISVQVGIYDQEGRRLSLIDSTSAGYTFEISEGEFRVVCRVEKVPLVSGRYPLNVAIKQGPRVIDVIERCAVLNVGNANLQTTGMMPEHGPLMLKNEWRICESAQSLQG